jgi:uracil-DNA glycosylase
MSIDSIPKIPINELDFGSESESSSEEIVIEPKKIINDKPKKTIFLDEDEESDDDINDIAKSKNKKIIVPAKFTKNTAPIVFIRKPLTDYIFADANNYSFKSWKQCFPDNKVTLRSLIFNPDWNDFFDIVEKKPYFKGMERIFCDYLEKGKETILPYAELTFNSFNILSPHQIKVLVIGQDPYVNVNKINDKTIPQAMGFSFSVPKNYPKPPSLQNIYKNLLDFGHIRKLPDSGCLSYWVTQGCFLINASFTTFYGKMNAHKNVWKDFTDDLMKYINAKLEKVVYLVWGAFAHRLCLNIDPYRHHIITSSHPSPMAYENTFTGFIYGKVKNPRDRKPVTYSSFKATDHFGRTNIYLKSVGKSEILWDLF